MLALFMAFPNKYIFCYIIFFLFWPKVLEVSVWPKNEKIKILIKKNVV